MFTVAQENDLPEWNDHREWEVYVSRGESSRELEKIPDVSTIAEDDSRVAVKVDNRTGFDLRYSAYGKQMPQLFFKKKQDGEWIYDGWFWCGTGMSSYPLKNKSSEVFHLNKNSENGQIFTVFRDAEDSKFYRLVKLYEKDND
tara:strand:- start:2240 stop:2668 length:429 start_codon:yes stop_codon:yes gene_type:complete